MTEKQARTFAAVADCLEYLEEKGWSELIDSRWENDVVKDLKEKFPDISDEVLGRTLSLVLI